MATVGLSSGEIYYEVHGQGAPLVILRGWGRSIRHWMGFEKVVAKSFKVIAPDARGIGRSSARPGWDLTTRDMALDVIRVLDQEKISSAHVFGVSLGGMIALTAGAQFPDRVTSVTAVNSSFQESGHLRLSMSALSVLGSALFNREKFQELLADVLVGSAMSAEDRRELADAWRHIDRMEPVRIDAAVKQLIAAARFSRKSFAGLTKPALLIYGTEDKFVPCQNTEKLAQEIPHAHVVAVKLAGHEPTLAHGEEILQHLNEFVAKVRTAGR